ncbi:carboxypeptidase Y inhibitor [Taxawa tesnikishii (nom. ined.)]|nr:carboxypeptidase Y inhibitor [Dothideales sp. JES 119]
MHASLTLVSLLAAGALGLVAPKQQPLEDQSISSSKLDLIYELKKAEIIPTVIDTFTPSVSISIEWSNATAEYGNTINPSKVQEEPSLKLVDSPPSVRSSMQYTVALTDPDAPSRDDPEWSEICHWIATFVPLTSSSDSDAGTLGHLKEIMPYKPPGPPPKTGKHRYVFVALAPKNGTTDKLHLSEPADRQHWGYDKERQGVRMWAESNGLEVVGANFIYAKNDEQ